MYLSQANLFEVSTTYTMERLNIQAVPQATPSSLDVNYLHYVGIMLTAFWDLASMLVGCHMGHKECPDVHG